MSPEEFVKLLDQGAFDGRLESEMAKLSADFLKQVAHILMSRTNSQNSGASDIPKPN